MNRIKEHTLVLIFFVLSSIYNIDWVVFLIYPTYQPCTNVLAPNTPHPSKSLLSVQEKKKKDQLQRILRKRFYRFEKSLAHPHSSAFQHGFLTRERKRRERERGRERR
jgi:hypothetical protein